MDVILVRGGCKLAPWVAQKCGMKYGIRHDYKEYGDVFMLDIKFKHRKRPAYLWQSYMKRVHELRPQLAMAEDYGVNHTDAAHSLIRARMIKQVADLRIADVPQVMVCPKFPGAVHDIPPDCRVAVSVITQYAGFEPEMTELAERECHLLGGNPYQQLELIHKISVVEGRVLSVDGSYMWLKAEFGQYFSRDYRWVQTRRNRWITPILATISGRNIVRYINVG
jgi:hypothetical protein